MDKIVFLEPVLKTKIWGGKRIEKLYNYPISSDKTGEAWLISGHKEGSNIIKNGQYKGKTLKWLFNNRKDYFNDIDVKDFPLLVKIIDANDDLSVQVHPNDEGAKKYGDLGKTECWYILDAMFNTKIVYGHNAKTKEEFKRLIDADKYEELLKYKVINKGDFLFVPAGKVHALTKGMLVLEIQQSSDVTFRIFDYYRKDEKGNYRQLHILESVEATFIPDKKISNKSLVKFIDENKISELIKSKYFNVEKWEIKEKYYREIDTFILCFVLNGKGMINGTNIRRGDSFIITSFTKEITILGNIEVIISYL